MSDWEMWRVDVLLRSSGPRKRYSRTQWHQEYLWCESTGQYLCRGFWATPSFLEPSVVRETLGRLPLLEDMWRVDRRHTIIPLSALPPVPPEVGYQPVSKAYQLTFLQCHYWTRGRQSRTRARWQVKINVPVGRVWETIGSEGFLLDPVVSLAAALR
ncbi:uncharacterized protein LOC127290619 [Leptopilina boulardi]|uniref:uncharacterized protein LOC127290619 n=1 Tax=Leptopilina boulardi TaxID=63433 RepID=UPI0021F50808|nr:uncharacterized protein LOC127290619 [Leptopilina boulardi]